MDAPTATVEEAPPSVEAATQAQPIEPPGPEVVDRIVQEAKDSAVGRADDALRDGMETYESAGLPIHMASHGGQGSRILGGKPPAPSEKPPVAGPTDDPTRETDPFIIVDPSLEGSGEAASLDFEAASTLPPDRQGSASRPDPGFAPAGATGAQVAESGLMAVLVGAGITTALVLAIPLRLLLASLFSRIRRPKLLDQAGRNQVFEAVRASPWSSVPELRRATGLSRSSLRHHLAVLRRHGLVRIQTHGRVLRYAEIALGVPAVFEPEAERQVRSLLAAGPQPMAAAMRKLCESFGYSRYGAWKVVQRLANSGTASLERRGARVWLTGAGGRGASGIRGAEGPSVAGSP